MNRKQVIFLIIAVVVIGGLGLVVSNKKSQSWEASSQQLGGKVIKNLSVDAVNAVEQIKVRQHAGEVNLSKQGEVWGVQERGGYPANFGNISELLKKLMDLKVAQPVRVTEKQLARLELTPPDKGTNSGTIVELKEKGGKAAAAILLGKKHMK